MKKTLISFLLTFVALAVPIKAESHLIGIRDHRVALMKYGIRDLAACISKIYQFDTGNMNYDRTAVSFYGQLDGKEGIYFIDPEDLRTYFAKIPEGAVRDVIWSYPVCWKSRKDGTVHKQHGSFYPGSAPGERAYPAWSRISMDMRKSECKELAQHIPSDSLQVFPIAQKKISELYEARLREMTSTLSRIEGYISRMSTVPPPSREIQFDWGRQMENVLFEIKMLGPHVDFEELMSCAKVMAPHHEKVLSALDELQIHATTRYNVKNLTDADMSVSLMMDARTPEFQRAISILQLGVKVR